MEIPRREVMVRQSAGKTSTSLPLPVAERSCFEMKLRQTLLFGPGERSGRLRGCLFQGGRCALFRERVRFGTP